ncbi:MAG: LytTR family DNA-binding domain-containing protein [Pseudomonadota bacterium]
MPPVVGALGGAAPKSVRPGSGPAILVFSVLLGVALAALGPADTEQLSLLGRAFFWIAQVSVGAALCLALETACGLQPSSRMMRWTVSLGCALAATWIYTPFAWQLELLFGLSISSGDLLQDWQQEWRQLVVPFVLCWLLLRRIAPWPEGAQKLKGSTATQPSRAELATTADERRWPELPAELGEDIVWVKAEEHYLKVVTRRGQALIRFSLQAALRGPLKDVNGLQVHRSYWVGTQHVRRLLQSPEGWWCEMIDGERVPVSRRRRTQVKKALAQRVVYPQPEAPAGASAQSNQ